MNFVLGVLAALEDQETVDLWLTIISITFVVLLIALAGFTLGIRCRSP